MESYLIILFGTRIGTLRGKVQLNLVNGVDILFVFLTTIDDKLKINLMNAFKEYVINYS